MHDNLRGLKLDVLDMVNLRTAAGIDDRLVVPGTLTPRFDALAEVQQGLIRHLGLSTVSLDRLAEAQRIAPVVCVQSFFNITNRADAAGLAPTAEQHIAYVPYFPLGSFSPLQSDLVESVAKRLGGTPMAVAQSWLLQHSPNIMLIPGTSLVGHLRENVAGAAWPRRRRAGRDLSSGRPRRGSVLRCSGRANHRDPVTPSHLPGGKPGKWPASRQELSAAD